MGQAMMCLMALMRFMPNDAQNVFKNHAKRCMLKGIKLKGTKA